MFDREGFMEYVGEKSGNSYASGLARIEKMYSVDLDGEYEKDKCDVLLKQIEQDKHSDGLSAKDSKRLSDFASHLKRYIAYRLNSVDTVADRVQFVIKHYKEHFASVDKEERYKWEALGWYKKHWNIEAEDFATMLETAFRQDKFVNLLASNMYWPYKMAVEFAKADPEAVRSLFRILYDESMPLAERYTMFRNGFSEQYKPQELNHYQDLHAVSVYLSCEYPEKYYIYKSTIYTTLRDRIGFAEGKTAQKSVVWKVESYAQMCNLILAEINQDAELIKMHRSRLNESCYQDEAFHLLAMDIVYYGSNYMTEDDFKHRSIEKSDTIYWPSLEEYDPGITKEAWIAVLKDSEITTPENLGMLKKMLELGGEVPALIWLKFTEMYIAIIMHWAAPMENGSIKSWAARSAMIPKMV